MRPVISAGLSASSSLQARVGEQRREILEPDAVARFVDGDLVDEVDAHERGILLAARGRTRRALDVVALAQPEAAHLRRRDVRIVAAREVPRRAEEAVALVAQVEQTLDLDQVAVVLVATAVDALRAIGPGVALDSLDATVARTFAIATPPPAPALVGRIRRRRARAVGRSARGRRHRHRRRSRGRSGPAFRFPERTRRRPIRPTRGTREPEHGRQGPFPSRCHDRSSTALRRSHVRPRRRGRCGRLRGVVVAPRRGRISAISSAGSSRDTSAFSSSAMVARSSVPAVRLERTLRGAGLSAPFEPVLAASTIAVDQIGLAHPADRLHAEGGSDLRELFAILPVQL